MSWIPAKALRKRSSRAARRPRRFLRAGVSVDAFLSEITRTGANYAVWRGFQGLPEVAPGKDIDLLVSDEDLPIVESMLSPAPQSPPTQAVELHSVSGMRNTDYVGVPFFLPKLALQVLQNAILLNGKYRVPCARDHFNALAFHAVYHEGEASGLAASRSAPPTVTAPDDDDVVATLRRVRRQLRERSDLTLAGLDRYLQKSGLRPAGDLLDRYQIRNPWLRRKLASERRDIGHLAGLTTFVIRDRAIGYIEDALAIIERHGFEVLHAFHLTDEERARVRDRVRGGNWACGPFPQSGGDPAAIIVAYDFSYRPAPAGDGQLVNDNAAFTKATIRDRIHGRLQQGERFNPLHSTDNGWQSLECLTDLGREGLLADCRERIAAIENKLQLPWPVTRELSVTGRRARVLVVDHPVHGEVVAKVFRPGAARFFERELRARQELGGLPCVPKLLDHGENWLLTPLYSNTSAHVLRKLPRCREVQLTFGAMMSLATLVRGLRERNYFLLDLSTHNLISDAKAGLLVLDFEFLQPYPIPTPPLERDSTIRGVAPHPGCDSPVYKTPGRWDVRVRSSVFHPAICGLPVADFFGRANPALRAKMAAYQAFWWVAFAAYRRAQIASRRKPVRAAFGLLHKANRVKLPAGRMPMAMPVPSVGRR